MRFAPSDCLSGGENKEILTDLLEMSETRTKEIDRISCEEEDRLSRGFDIKTYFTMPAGGLDNMRTAKIKNDDDEFLFVRFLPCARLVQINNKWWRSREKGFLMGLNSGIWKREGDGGATAMSNVKVSTQAYGKEKHMILQPSLLNRLEE